MFNPIWHSSILRSPDSDPAGGGGGDEPPKLAFTEEQFVAIGEIVNKALTSKAPKMVSSAVAEGLKGINWEETLGPVVTKLVPPPKTPDDHEGEGEPKRKAKVDPEVERRISELAAQLEAEKSARGAADRARIESENARRLDNAKVALRTKLADKLAPGMLEHAVDRWTIVQNRLKVADDGTATFRVRKAPYKGAPLEDADVALDEAIVALLEEDDTKFYLPSPKGGGGSGNPGPKSNGTIPTYDKPATTDAEKARRALERENALKARGFSG